MLEGLAILAGIAVGFAAFVYGLAALEKLSVGAGKNDKRAGTDREDPRAVFAKPWTAPVPRPRICPLCGTYLGRGDYLFAALGADPPPGSARKRQAQIYGCPYCYGSAAAKQGQLQSAEI